MKGKEMKLFVLAPTLLLILNFAVPAAAASSRGKSQADVARHSTRSDRASDKGHRARHAAAGERVGTASYYRNPQRVASGARFNPNAMTAAHKTLPFGTLVRVKHLDNGRTVDVRINDRGPYVAGRILDLSRAAAAVIGMTARGVARVSMTVLGR
jgi:rare lipoprotein A